MKIYSHDIDKEFWIKICDMLIMKKEKKRNNGRDITTKSGKYQNTKRKNSKNVGILVADYVKQREMYKKKKEKKSGV